MKLILYRGDNFIKCYVALLLDDHIQKMNLHFKSYQIAATRDKPEFVYAYQKQKEESLVIASHHGLSFHIHYVAFSYQYSYFALVNGLGSLSINTALFFVPDRRKAFIGAYS